MNRIDHLELDGKSLTTFLTILEEMSVSRAAERLGVTQFAVSHSLDKLRAIFDDPDHQWIHLKNCRKLLGQSNLLLRVNS